VSQLTYPNEVGEFFHPQVTGTGFMKYSPGPTETHYDPSAYRMPSTTTSQNYNIPYDSVSPILSVNIAIEQL
jgi:hypothetical protein